MNPLQGYKVKPEYMREPWVKDGQARFHASDVFKASGETAWPATEVALVYGIRRYFMEPIGFSGNVRDPDE